MAADRYLREVLADGARPVRHRSGVRELLGAPDDGARIVFPALPRGGLVYLRGGGAAPTWATGIAESRWEVQVVDDPADPWPEGPDGPDAPEGPGADGPARRPPAVRPSSPTGAARGGDRPTREAAVAPPDAVLGRARGTATVLVPGVTTARAASGAAAGPRARPAGDPAPDGRAGPGAASAPVASPAGRPGRAEAAPPSVLPASTTTTGPDGPAPRRDGVDAAPAPAAWAGDAAGAGDPGSATLPPGDAPGRTVPQIRARSAPTLWGRPADPPRRPHPGWPDPPGAPAWPEPPVGAPARLRPPVAAPGRPRPANAAPDRPRPPVAAPARTPPPDEQARPPAPHIAAPGSASPPVLRTPPPPVTGAAAFWERCHVGRLRGRILR
jgi:hypothetical protein